LLSTTFPSELLLEEGWRAVTTGKMVAEVDSGVGADGVGVAAIGGEREYTGIEPEPVDTSELVCLI
jgi:hypothetical protein